MKRSWRYVTLLIIAGLWMSCSPPKEETKSAFISTDGHHLMLNNKPYYFAGTNMWYGAYLGMPGSLGNRERLTRELDLLKEKGITNLRILGNSQLSSMKMAIEPAFQMSLDSVNAQLLVGLDFLLAEMHKRNMHAVIYLNNYWQWSGGMSQYVSWVENSPIIDPDDPEQDWQSFMFYSARFYELEQAISESNAYTKMLINRKNSISGKLYKNDDTIMAWQLANEPRPAPDAVKNDTSRNAYISWITSTAKMIKAEDTNHLLSIGSEGTMGTLENESIYRSIHQIPEIDYMTFHLWIKNWGWFDAHDIEGTYPDAEIKALAYIDKHLDIAREMNKPAVLEEFGAERDSGLFQQNSSHEARDRFFKAVYQHLYQNASNNGCMAGSNFWAWGGEGRAEHPDSFWRDGDTSFTGDPPQEAQGLNSVFDQDSTTLAIIKTHALALDKLSQQSNQLQASY